MNLYNPKGAQPNARHRLPLWVLVFSFTLIAPIWNLQAATTFTGCGGGFVGAPNAQAEAQVVELVNAERAKVGLPPYKAVAELTDAARYHSADMAADRYRDHYTYDRDATDTLVQVCTWTAFGAWRGRVWSGKVPGSYGPRQPLVENIVH